jgi:F-type H+-transporting ATPase subunit b
MILALQDNPLVQPDPGLFIWTILTFLVLLWGLKRFAWGPLLQALDRRSQTIAKAVDDAERARVEVERVKQESAKILAQSRVEAEAIIMRTRADASQFREELKQQAKADAAAILAKAEREIQLESRRAIEEVRREAIDLSVAIASKLLRRNVTKEDNQALIDDTIKQLDTTKH